jgi:hypothetical protein
MAPEAGAQALEQLAASGDAEAAARAAVVAGAGFGRKQDWSAALDWLVAAAELGHSAARAQLGLLAREPAPAPEADWRALGKAVDVQDWIAARPTKLVVGAPRIGVAERFLEAELCSWFIDRGRPLQTPARVYSPATGGPMQHDTRSNTAAGFTILELDLPMLLIRARIANTLGVPTAFLERFNIFRYKTGQRFSWHMDYLDPTTPQFAQDLARRGQRAATFLVYLNEGFEGGETNFVTIRRSLKGKLGDAVFFHNVDAKGNPDRLTAHEGAAPTAGEKWLLSQFIRDRPQLQG